MSAFDLLQTSEPWGIQSGMLSRWPLRLIAIFLVLLFAVTTFIKVRGNVDAIELTLWGTSPHLMALAVLLAARDPWLRRCAGLAIGLFWLSGVAVFFRGGPAAIFLPVAEIIGFWTVLSALIFFKSISELTVRR